MCIFTYRETTPNKPMMDGVMGVGGGGRWVVGR